MTTLLGCLPTSPAEVAFPGPAPGTASAEQSASGYTLSNNILTAKFTPSERKSFLRRNDFQTGPRRQGRG